MLPFKCAPQFSRLIKHEMHSQMIQFKWISFKATLFLNTKKNTQHPAIIIIIVISSVAMQQILLQHIHTAQTSDWNPIRPATSVETEPEKLRQKQRNIHKQTYIHFWFWLKTSDDRRQHRCKVAQPSWEAHLLARVHHRFTYNTHKMRLP